MRRAAPRSHGTGHPSSAPGACCCPLYEVKQRNYGQMLQDAAGPSPTYIEAQLLARGQSRAGLFASPARTVPSPPAELRTYSPYRKQTEQPSDKPPCQTQGIGGLLYHSSLRLQPARFLILQPQLIVNSVCPHERSGLVQVLPLPAVPQTSQLQPQVSIRYPNHGWQTRACPNENMYSR